MSPTFTALSRALLRKIISNNRNLDVGLGVVKLKLDLKPDEPTETRSGMDLTDKRPFYQSDSATLFNWYYGYQNTLEYFDNVLYVDVIPLRTGEFHGITLDAIRSEDLVVDIEPSSYRIPEKLKAHAEVAVSHFKDMGKLRYFMDKKEWENNTSLRIKSISPQGRVLCQKARYFHQVGTNITLDWASECFGDKWRTIRINLERPVNGKLRPLNESILANTLGVAVMFYNQQLLPIIRIRSDSLASIPKQGLHCTASGVHEVDPDQLPGHFDYSILKRGMIKEIKHEIGLNETEYNLYPVAFARELPRGGKPQLFFIAVSRVSNDRIREAMASAEEAYEYIIGDALATVDFFHNSELTSNLFTYEGWACMRFAERFVEANQQALFQSLSQTHAA